MLRTVFRTVAALVMAGLLCGADYLGERQCELSRSIGETNFQIIVFDSSYNTLTVKPVIEKAFALIQEIMDRMDVRPSGETVTLDPDTMRMLSDALRFSGASEGAYDVASGALTELWAKAKENAEPPSDAEIAAARAVSGASHVETDAVASRLTVKAAGLKFDLRDVARGYAMDRAAEQLKKNGIRSAVIQNEGTVLCVGLSPSGRTWRLAVEHPRTVDQYAAVLEIPEEIAVTTVGDHDNFFIYKNRRYPLIVDPRTGRVPEQPIASVTLISPSAALSNVAAKAFFVLGPEKGFEMVERLKDEKIEAICLEEDRAGRFSLATSEAARAYLKDISL